MSEACCGTDKNNASSVGTGPETLWQVRELQLASLAAALLIIGWSLGRVGLSPAGLFTELAAALVGAATFVPDALRNLRHKRINVGTLMTIAAVGAVALGEIPEAALLGILFSIAEGLEHYAVSKTRRGLRALLSLVPPTATVIRGGNEITISPEELIVGETMVLHPGERAATDGLITAGRTTLDVSAITGESVPVEAGPGAAVYAGAINGGGAIEIQATATACDSSLARIVHIVEKAQEHKGSGQRLADRIARPLVPIIMGLAVVVAGAGALFGDPLVWIERALVVLVAASPCAMAIAVPLTVVAAIGAASRQGALIKGGAALEELGRIKVVALDKTGTLTRNAPQVIATMTVPGTTDSDALRTAAALEIRSEHPLAQAIIASSESPIPAATDVTAIPGHGIRGNVNGKPVRLGKPGWIAAGALADDVIGWQSQGATVVLLECSGALVAAVAVRDELRPEAAAAIQLLSDMGIRTVMLTGDNQRTAAALAIQAGITDVHAELLPEDKARLLGELANGHPIAMVGDGINDAPALATANVGIAMGAMGTDVAIEAADIALMGEDLRHLPQVLSHARQARRIMLQNIGLSLAIIISLIPLAASGVLGLATVVFIHEAAEVLVILNAIRGARIRPLPGDTQTPSPSSGDECECCSPASNAVSMLPTPGFGGAGSTPLP